MTVPYPHMRREQLLLRLPKRSVGVEVGVWKGDFSNVLLKVTQPEVLHLVDPWVSRPDRPDEWCSISQDEMDVVYQSVVDRFEPVDRVIVYRLPSVEAACLFDDDSLGWVYVDGDHTYDSVTEDLQAWFPKVKPGGVLCGDDFEHGHWWGDQVVSAVEDFAVDFGLTVENLRGQFWLSL